MSSKEEYGVRQIIQSLKNFVASAVSVLMPPPSAGQSTAAPANDSEPEENLVDRLRVAAIGGKSNRNMAQAKIAFDTSIDFERRARLLAGIAGEQPTVRKKTSWRKTIGWLPIPLGILAVMGLGSMLASRTTQSSKDAASINTQKKLNSKKSKDPERAIGPPDEVSDRDNVEPNSKRPLSAPHELE